LTAGLAFSEDDDVGRARQLEQECATGRQGEMMEPFTLLAVDDRSDNLLVIEALVGQHFPEGRLVTALSAAEGLARAEEVNLDGVLLDVQMPGMSGIEMCRQLKANEKTAAAPIILITAHRSSPKLKAEGLEAGADDFVTKPIDNIELVAKIRVMLRTKRAEDRLRRLNALLEDLVEEKTQALREERDLLSTTLHTLAALVIVLDCDERVVRFNRACEQLTGYSFADVVGRRCNEFLVPPSEQHLVSEAFARLRCGKAPRDYESHVVSKLGARRLIAWAHSALCDEHGQLEQIICTGVDITDRVQAEKRLRENERRLDHLAHHDTLTALPNRLLFHDRLNQAITRAERSGMPLSLLFLDLDGFKYVNDVFGHEQGDNLLKDIAKRLKACVRGGDTVARLGGDEFTIVLENLRGPEDAVIVSRKVLDEIGHPVDLGGHRVTVGTSIGITCYPKDGKDVETLVKNAGAAMYLAKEAGKGCYRFYTRGLDRQLKVRTLAEDNLKQAIDKDQLVVHYQPQVAVESSQIIGAEALIRWQHPALGLIPPGEFIPLAEETGLIVPLTKWIAAAVCRQNAAWQQSGLQRVRIAINISPLHFRQGGLVSSIADVLERSGLEPRWLELELTESVVMSAPDQAVPILEELHQMGVTISLDDFGTGYSSLSYLQRFPINKLKIDRSFVKDIGKKRVNGARSGDSIVVAIIHMARDLGVEVVAEGVENDVQATFLREKGCVAGQGYLFGHPVAAGEFWKGRGGQE
jgi:diguanylate cyclase (GGDEF)-like protein/PAS domain S-box-containing protein